MTGVAVQPLEPTQGLPVRRSKALPVGYVLVSDPRGAYGRVLLVGDSDRYPDGVTERVRRLAIADAVETVRAGLQHLVPRDRDLERAADLLRPSRPRGCCAGPAAAAQGPAERREFAS